MQIYIFNCYTLDFLSKIDILTLSLLNQNLRNDRFTTKLLNGAWDNRSLLTDKTTIDSIREVINLLDKGLLRVAEPTNNGWQVNEWIKKSRSSYTFQFKK